MEGGGSFKSWQEDIYWTHFHFIHFTQFLTTHFQQQLALPKTFSNNVKKKLHENVTLKAPSGVVYIVGLTTRDDTLYFTNGWQQFVNDHFLKENDLLVFKYNGKSHFEVLIFDRECFCEKAASYFVGKCGHAQTEQGGGKAKEKTATGGEGQNCNGFKSWEEDIYWTHFQFIHFTQYLSTRFEQQLAVPKTFSNNVKKKLTENVTLKAPNGVVYNVGVTTRDDTLYFTNGWQQFVKDHFLKENDLLVFKYNGRSHFEVLIFDGESFCEKAASYFVGKCGHAQTEQEANTASNYGGKAKETDNSVEKANIASNGGGGKAKETYNSVEEANITSNSGGKAKETDNSVEEANIVSNGGGGKAKETDNSVEEANIASNGGGKAKETDNFVEEANIASNGGVECGLHEKFRHRNNIGTPLAAPFKTTNEKTFNAGVEFASPEQVMDDAITKTAPAAFPSPTTGKRTKRPDNEVATVQNKQQGTSPIAGWKTNFFSKLSARHGVTRHETSKDMPTSPKFSLKRKNKIDLSDKKLSKIGQEAVLATYLRKSSGASNTSKKMGICSMSKTAHKKLATPKRHCIEDEQSSQAKADLKMLSSADEQRVAEAFNSPFPNFVRIMKAANVSGSRSLRLPHKFSSAHLPNCKTEITLCNSRGECWTVNSVPASKGIAHTFCGGWMAFVRDNGINIGDTCIFELVSHHVMQVHVSRFGKEGPDHQNGNVKLNS